MNSYNSFITDNEAYRHILVNIVKNLSHIQVLNSKLVTSGRAVAHLMNFKNYKNLNIGECFFDSVMISLEEIDDDWPKNIFVISDNLKKNQSQIQQWLNFEKQMCVFEDYANFYIFTNENVKFDHPRLKVFDLSDSEDEIYKILKEEDVFNG